MNFLFSVTLLVTLALLAAVLYRWLCRISEYSPSDVAAFLQKVDMEVLHGIFHSEAEEALRQRLGSREFREVQWKRFHLAIHHCNLLTANCRVLQGWALYARRNTWNYLSSDLRSAVLELKSGCMQCRLGALVIRFRLRLWLLRMRLVPWFPAPTFNALLRLGSGDMISFYDKIRETAELFSLAYGEDYHQKLMQTL